VAVFDISELRDENEWWVDKKNILKDVNIEDLNKLKYQWDPRIKYKIPLDKDIICSIRGPRQVGKTTLLKIIIKDLLLTKEVKPENIFYWSCEINSAEEVRNIIKTYLDWRVRSNDARKYLFIDEICGVKDWSDQIIYFANRGKFKNTSVIVTGSHALDIKRSIERMPGRRGGLDNATKDKILLPMKFVEFATLVAPEFKEILEFLDIIKTENRTKIVLNLFKGKIDENIIELTKVKKDLEALFNDYLLTGGIPATINGFMEYGEISTGLFNIYLESIKENLTRYGLKERYFKQLLREIIDTISTPVSWNGLRRNTDIGSHSTVQDYISALEDLFIAGTVHKYTIHDNKINIRSNKKIYLHDPFIFHALNGWVNAKRNYFTNSKSTTLNLEAKSKLVESVIYNHLCRFAYNLNPRDGFDPKDYICYYRDDKDKEIDFLLLFDDNVYPFEVKYQATIANSDFTQFKPFNKGVLITKNQLGIYGNYVKIPVPILLTLI
jgi:predicted AAA+ superfamily ATPase